MLKLRVGGPRVLGGARRSFALVASQYNPEYVQALVDHTAVELMRVLPSARLVLHQVPGAFEIPLVVQELAAKKENELDVIIALGVILQGETDHADLLARTVTDALQQIALSQRLPIIHQVLTCKDEEQARMRCIDTKFNRGIEAARAAISMSHLLSQLRE